MVNGGHEVRDYERDFFISYTKSDEQWAEWIAITLMEHGYTTTLQAFDFRPGQDFADRMDQAIQKSERTIAVLSPTYLKESAFGRVEWLSAFADDPLGRDRKLIPVRVAECAPAGLLKTRIYVDLVGTDEATARALLVEGVDPADSVVAEQVLFPGAHVKDRPARATHVDFPGEPGESPGAQTSSDTSSPVVAEASRREADVRSLERSPWAWVSADRPRIENSLPAGNQLIGHRAHREWLKARLNSSETAALVVITGPAGSGKSSLMSWVKRVAGERVVDAGATVARKKINLGAEGEGVDCLLEALAPDFEDVGDHSVLVFDDVDHHLREAGVQALVQKSIATLGAELVVLSLTTAQSPRLFPVPVTELRLDRRHAEPEEFQRYVARVLRSFGVSASALDDTVRRSLYDMSEYTTNFRAFQYVVETLVSYHLWSKKAVRPADLAHLLSNDAGTQRLYLPAVRSRRGQRLGFRRKDKAERLADVLLRHFHTPEALAEAAKCLDGFDERSFLEDAEESVVDAVQSLCFTYSPRGLALLLAREQIEQEIGDLRLDPGQLFADRRDKADLLVRGLGFTLVDQPRGLTEYQTAVASARALVDQSDETAALNGAVASAAEHVGSALLELLQFWATRLFGSVHQLVKAANAAPGRQQTDFRDLSPRRIAELLDYLNRSAQGDVTLDRLAFPRAQRPISLELFAACAAFATALEEFSGTSGPAAEHEFLGDLRDRCVNVVSAAADVLERAAPSYPAVIKLSEIVFDEYSRRIFRGVDSDGNDVRFAMTGDDEMDELVVAKHYFMLPKKQRSVNPFVVPYGGTPTPVLFDRAHAYDRSSDTQRQQAERLLERAELTATDSVLEVGSGTGALALKIASRVHSVHGIDAAAGMVQLAKERAAVRERTNVTFEEVALLDYRPRATFDVVLSNSAMHWILPADRAYGHLFRLLRPGGRLAVHQGGRGTYRGLHEFTVRLIEALHLEQFFSQFTYPAYYPTRDDLSELLTSIGFADVDVDPYESDGLNYPNLLADFSQAGLLPYLAALPEVHREFFRAEWLAEAEDGVTDRYTYRLYATARRP
jgi:SAM-dependent methyltransferase